MIVVVKKNKRILENLRQWLSLRAHDGAGGRERISGIPLLVIDDEPDNASVNTKPILGERVWQLERISWRGTLAGCRVTICEHLDGQVSIVYGPHRVGLYTAEGQPLKPAKKRRAPRCGNDAPWKAWRAQRGPRGMSRRSTRSRTPA